VFWFWVGVISHGRTRSLIRLNHACSSIQLSNTMHPVISGTTIAWSCTRSEWDTLQCRIMDVVPDISVNITSSSQSQPASEACNL
jgi:hypothetical protein